MPVAVNPKTGEVLTLGPDGQWAPPKMASNPETGEKLFLDGSEWKPLPALGQMTPQDRQIEQSRLMPRVQGALEQGVTFGFGDEVGAAGAATGRFLKDLTAGAPVSEAWKNAGQRYDEKLLAERAAGKEFAKENPVTNAGLETLGGLAIAPATIGAGAAAVGGGSRAAGAAPSMARTMGQAAAGAGLTGGIAGFGSSEGGFGNRMQDAATTAAVSGLIGGVTPLAMKGIGEGVETVKNLLGTTNADETAQRLILRAMERDNIPVMEAIQRYNAGQLTGAKPEALVDIGGENLRGLARGAASVPGPARQMTQDFIANRQAGQGGRIADDVAAHISPNKDYAGAVDDLLAMRARNASPLYKEAFNDPTPIYSDRLKQFLDDPITHQGLARGYKVQRLEALANNEPFDPKMLAITGFNEAGDPILGGTPNLRSLDAVKRGLDDILEGYRDKTTGKLVLDETGRAIDQVRKAYVKTVDELAPDVYKQARAAWSGPSQSKDAMALGRNILRMDSDVTAKAIKNLSENDREFFKAGVVRAIKDAADNAPDGADITKRFFGKPALREKLAAAFDSPDQFKAFEDAIKREAGMVNTARAINPKAGSPTAIIQEEQRDLRKNPVVQFATDAVRPGGGLLNATGNALGALYDRGRGINPNTSEALARMLLETDPAKVGQLGQKLGGQTAADQRRALEIARQLGLIGTAEGRTIGAASN